MQLFPLTILTGQRKEEKHMKRNIGKTERIIRAIAGIGIMCLVFEGSKTPWA